MEPDDIGAVEFDGHLAAFGEDLRWRCETAPHIAAELNVFCNPRYRGGGSLTPGFEWRSIELAAERLNGRAIYCRPRHHNR